MAGSSRTIPIQVPNLRPEAECRCLPVSGSPEGSGTTDTSGSSPVLALITFRIDMTIEIAARPYAIRVSRGSLSSRRVELGPLSPTDREPGTNVRGTVSCFNIYSIGKLQRHFVGMNRWSKETCKETCSPLTTPGRTKLDYDLDVPLARPSMI